jgi:putative membrane protein (TIGR04086 family)
MAKVSRRTRNYPQAPRNTNIPMAIFKGVAVSIAVSLICAIFLSLISLISENRFIDTYLEYIMVALTTTSIFIGSIYAAKQVAAKGLIIGCAVGIIYVLFSVGIGIELGQEQISWLMLSNKFAAGSLAGALGGFIGVNL